MFVIRRRKMKKKKNKKTNMSDFLTTSSFALDCCPFFFFFSNQWGGKGLFITVWHWWKFRHLYKIWGPSYIWISLGSSVQMQQQWNSTSLGNSVRMVWNHEQLWWTSFQFSLLWIFYLRDSCCWFYKAKSCMLMVDLCLCNPCHFWGR